MNSNQFARTRLTFGKENMEKLYNARVIVFGIGGVGSYVVEALARSGIGAIDIVDDDKICLTKRIAIVSVNCRQSLFDLSWFYCIKSIRFVTSIVFHFDFLYYKRRSLICLLFL